MRSTALALAVAVIAACGASAGELKVAKTATYRVAAGTLLDLAVQAAQESYKIAQVDAGHLRIATVPRFYSSEGDLESEGAEGYVQVQDRSVRVAFVVQLTETDYHEIAVTVTPEAWQYILGSPQMRPLPADDPNLPPWVHGRADALSLAIYQHAKQYSDDAPPAR
jgi:hypothetical protein